MVSGPALTLGVLPPQSIKLLVLLENITEPLIKRFSTISVCFVTLAMRNKQQSKRHMEKKHQIAGLALKCEGCGRLFGQKNFERHKLTCGNKMKPFSCTEAGCPKAYRSKWMLDNHMKTVHPGVDQNPVTFTCEFCAKTLGSKQALGFTQKAEAYKGKQNDYCVQFEWAPILLSSI